MEDGWEKMGMGIRSAKWEGGEGGLIVEQFYSFLLPSPSFCVNIMAITLIFFWFA
jgi:hypothetical protein